LETSPATYHLPTSPLKFSVEIPDGDAAWDAGEVTVCAIKQRVDIVAKNARAMAVDRGFMEFRIIEAASSGMQRREDHFGEPLLKPEFPR